MEKRVTLSHDAHACVRGVVVAALATAEGPHSPERRVLDLYDKLAPEDRAIFATHPPAITAHTTKLVCQGEHDLVVLLDPAEILDEAQRDRPFWAEACRIISQIEVCEVPPGDLDIQEVGNTLWGYTAAETRLIT